MRQITKAMVLGAGYGQRMRPLTNDIPKPLVALDEKPLIDHVLERIDKSQIGTAVVNVHYLADKLETHLETRRSPNIIISDERDQLLDTGGGVKKALPYFENEPFLIHNADSVWMEGSGYNLDRLVDHWDPDKMDCLLLLALICTSIGYEGQGDFYMDRDGKIRRREEKEYVPFVFAGASIMNPKLFENTPDGPFSLNLIWDRALENGRLYGIRHEGIWMHVGTPEALEDAEEVWRLG